MEKEELIVECKFIDSIVYLDITNTTNGEIISDIQLLTYETKEHICSYIDAILKPFIKISDLHFPDVPNLLVRINHSAFDYVFVKCITSNGKHYNSEPFKRFLS